MTRFKAALHGLGPHNCHCRAFSDFKVQKSLGEGAMSSVVHCVCVRSGVHTAIKMYHKDRMNAMNVKQVGWCGSHCQFCCS
jgi:serine/threonine protein kinase